MSANQLLEKALSSASEDEAIACLRMARKKGLKLTTLPETSQYERDLQDKLYKQFGINKGLRKDVYTLQARLVYLEDKLASYGAASWVLGILSVIALLSTLIYLTV